VAAHLPDPPDTDFQRGFLAALLVFAEEALGLRMDMPPFAEAQKLCLTATGRINGARRNLARCIRQMEELLNRECD
jgi:hypothetical protein